MNKNLYVIVKMEAFSDRPELLFASTSKVKIDAKLEDLKNEIKQENIFDYVEGDCLIMEDDSAYYIEKVDELI